MPYQLSTLLSDWFFFLSVEHRHPYICLGPIFSSELSSSSHRQPYYPTPCYMAISDELIDDRQRCDKLQYKLVFVTVQQQGIIYLFTNRQTYVKSWKLICITNPYQHPLAGPKPTRSVMHVPTRTNYNYRFNF